MNSATIIQAKENDVSAVKRLIHETIRFSYKIAYPQGVVDFFLDYHNDDFIKNNIINGVTLIMNVSDRMIGTIYLHGNTMGGMYIHPEFQGRGYGRILFEKMLQVAKTRKLSYVQLDSTLLAKKLYDSFGFKTIDFVYQPMDNGDRLYYFIMKKEL